MNKELWGQNRSSHQGAELADDPFRNEVRDEFRLLFCESKSLRGRR